jgi:hypothetical protein
MRRLLALSLLISSLACGCAAGLTAPAALAAGSTSTAATTTPATTTPATSTPSFGLSNAEQNAVTPTTNNVAPVTTSSSGGGFSGLDAFIVGIVGVVVLFGIAFWVWRDARTHAARVGHGPGSDAMFGRRAHAGSKTPPRARKLTAAERKRRKRGRAR